MHRRNRAAAFRDHGAQKALQHGLDIAGIARRRHIGVMLLAPGQTVGRRKPGAHPCARHRKAAGQARSRGEKLRLEPCDEGGPPALPVLTRHPGIIERGGQQAAHVLGLGPGDFNLHKRLKQSRGVFRCREQLPPETRNVFALRGGIAGRGKDGAHVRDGFRTHWRSRG